MILCILHLGQTKLYSVLMRCLSAVLKRRLRPVGDRKVAGSILESGISSLCPWKRSFHWGHAVYPLRWPSPIKELQTEPKKGMSCADVVEIYAGRLVHTKEEAVFTRNHSSTAALSLKRINLSEGL